MKRSSDLIESEKRRRNLTQTACKGCVEKEQRIEELERERDYLKALAGENGLLEPVSPQQENFGLPVIPTETEAVPTETEAPLTVDSLREQEEGNEQKHDQAQ